MEEYKQIIPKRYHDVSYENDVEDEIKKSFKEQAAKRNGLYIYGESGVGKTHLVCALIKNILANKIEARFYNTGDLIEKLREDFERADSEDKEWEGLFRELMNFKGILVLDDLGAEKISDWARERLYLIINKKYEDMIPMIFTSNCDMEILTARMGDRVSSRIKEMTELIFLEGVDRRLEKTTNITNNEANQ
jgi:DNA replication protein DnaC